MCNWKFLFFLILSSNFVCGQDIIKFSSEVYLEVSIGEFYQDVHELTECSHNNFTYICKIDGKEWFGADLGQVPPKFQFDSIVFVLNEQRFHLDVSQMFNPTFSGKIDNRHFNLISNGGLYFLKGWFSDGAGTYCAQWEINLVGESKRTLLSTDEGDCFN